MPQPAFRGRIRHQLTSATNAPPATFYYDAGGYQKPTSFHGACAGKRRRGPLPAQRRMRLRGGAPSEFQKSRQAIARASAELSAFCSTAGTRIAAQAKAQFEVRNWLGLRGRRPPEQKRQILDGGFVSIFWLCCCVLSDCRYFF